MGLNKTVILDNQGVARIEDRSGARLAEVWVTNGRTHAACSMHGRTAEIVCDGSRVRVFVGFEQICDVPLA